MLWILGIVVTLTPDRADALTHPQCAVQSMIQYGSYLGFRDEAAELPYGVLDRNRETSLYICPDIIARHRSPLLRGGIYKAGDFMKAHCAQSCRHLMRTGGSVVCGTRRPPMIWTNTLVSQFTSAMPCGDLRFPISETAPNQHLILYPTGDFPDAVLQYLKRFPWKGILVNDVYDDFKKTLQNVTAILDAVPTIDELYFEADNDGTAKVRKYMWPLFSARPWKIISIGTNFGGHNDLPANTTFNVSQLKALRLFAVDLAEIPSWVKDAHQLQYLQVDSRNGKTIGGLENIENLPELEHLMLTRTNIKTFPRLNSPKLITLDLNCNMITEYPDNVFENLTEIQFLTLRNNPLPYISQAAMRPLTNLKHLDFGQQTYYPYAALGPLSMDYYVNRAGRTFTCRDYDVNDGKLTNFSAATLPNPEKLLSLELPEQKRLKFDADYFARFPNLMSLNLHGVNLVSLDGVGLEKLASLNLMRASGINFTADVWMPETFLYNLTQLQYIYLQDSNIKASAPWIAMAKTSPRFNGELGYEFTVYRFSYMDSCSQQIMNEVANNVAADETCADDKATLMKDAKRIIEAKFALQRSVVDLTGKV